MITVIVGHRGAGKSKFLSRLESYFAELQIATTAVCLDLDHEIEKQTGRTIAEVFKNAGEFEFRRLEREVFNRIYEQYHRSAQNLFVALGAGFSHELPRDVEVWWLRRESDSSGRIFVDRPRLDDKTTPLEEYRNRYQERETRYRRIAHKQITLSEGWDQKNPFEPKLLGYLPEQTDYSITVRPWHLENPVRRELFISTHLQLGARFFEMRDDELSEPQICEMAQELPSERVLISFRKKEPSPSLIEFAGPYATDWALELGPSPLSHNSIVSLHKRNEGETIDEAAARLLAHKAEHHKLAVTVADLTELWVGHRFFLEDSKRRSFLPMSAEGSQPGKWQWYRLSQNKKLYLNFAREGDSEYRDQPLVFDFLRYPCGSENFAAILGDPVTHSRTPAEQSDFFREHGMGVVAIPLHESEMNSLNFGILERLGLRAAAVTAPLKIAAVKVCEHLNKKAADLGAVNTLFRGAAGWSGTNTDLDGVARTFHSLNLTNNTVVWGGGGTRLVLRALLPMARYFSARRGTEIWSADPSESASALQSQGQSPASQRSPQNLIWAIGRSRMSEAKWPPAEWHPEFVFDLNYTEDSPGREYALKIGARYISGLNVFLEQAKAQREFWQREFRALREPANSTEEVAP